MRGRERAEAEKRERHRNAGFFGQRVNFALRAGENDAVAGQNDRPPGLVDESERGVDFLLAREENRFPAMRLGSRGFPVENAGGLLGVLGDVQEHRAGPVGRRNLKGFAQRRSNFLGARDQIVVLGDRKRDSGDVAFLESVGPDHRAADLAGDANDRGRIHHRRGDPGDHVGGARAGGGHGHSHSSAGARVAIGHVRGALFVADQNVVNLGPGQRVIGRQDGAAGIAEYARDVQGLEGLPNNVGARESLALRLLIRWHIRPSLRHTRHPPMTGPPRISRISKQGH